MNIKKLLGMRILSEANDIKRTVASLASELEIDEGKLKNIIIGDCEIEDSYEVIRLMGKKYPISVSDMYLEETDCDRSIKIMRSEQSKESSRIFNRKDRTGNKTPYYEYRDTAMSKIGPFKPEWIKELRIVKDNDPYNPDVAYNNGHFLHQATFFVGEVNFYWEADGKKYCREMDTGDSNYITPFYPHSFAARGKEALIIAVTYGGDVRRALKEIYLLGDKIKNFKLNMDNPPKEKIIIKNKDTYYPPHKGKNYRLWSLASSTQMEGYGIEVCTDEIDLKNPMVTSLHSYIYNYGDQSVQFTWMDQGLLYGELIHPGDSIYLMPFVKYAFANKGGKLFTIRVGGAVNLSTQKELSCFADIDRVIETKCWFD